MSLGRQFMEFWGNVMVLFSVVECSRRMFENKWTCKCIKMVLTVSLAFWHVYVLWLGVYWWKRDDRALHDMTSERYTTWCQICPTKDKISLHGSFTRMRILPHAYHNTITHIRFDASGYFSSSAIPLCASSHVSFAIW